MSTKSKFPPNKQEKFKTLMEQEGFEDELEFLQEISFDSICPGICRNPNCDYSTEVEPDQHGGWCEECNTQTVQSALVLKGMI